MPTIHTGSIRRAAQQLVQEVGADVARADDGGAELHGNAHSKRTAQSPIPSMVSCMRSPAATGTSGPSEPESTISPARSDDAELAERVGEPRQAQERRAHRRGAGAAVPMIAPFFSSLMRQPSRSTRAGESRGRRSPPACRDEALSATVSWILIFQSRMRESTISKHGLDAIGRREHVGRREARATRSRFSTNAISPSARGWIRRSVGTAPPSRSQHLGGQVAEVRLVDAEHLLHGLARHADLLADVRTPSRSSLPRDDRELDAVGVLDRDLRLALGERRDREALAQRPVELVAVGSILSGVHGLCALPSRLLAPVGRESSPPVHTRALASAEEGRPVIDPQLGAADRFGFVRRQKRDRVGDVARRAEPALHAVLLAPHEHSFGSPRSCPNGSDRAGSRWRVFAAPCGPPRGSESWR